MDHTLGSPTTSVYKPGQLKLLSSVKQTMSKRIRQTFPQGFPTWNFHGTSRELTAGLPLRSQIPGKCDKSLEPMFKVLRVYTKGGWGWVEFDGFWPRLKFGFTVSNYLRVSQLHLTPVAGAALARSKVSLPRQQLRAEDASASHCLPPWHPCLYQ